MKRLFGLFVLCVLVTGVCFFVREKQRNTVPERFIEVNRGEEFFYLDLDGLKLSKVDGESVNGKGEVKKVSAEGILLREAFDFGGFKEQKFVSSDEFLAIVTYDEAMDSLSVYLLVEEGKARLIVFGDSNSKRSVKDVIQIVVSDSGF